MRSTWIGTVAAAALATAAATGYAAAQEKEHGQPGAATQQMEKGQTQRGLAQGQMEKGERAQSVQTQSPQAQSTTGQERMGQERMGQQRNEKPGMENKAAQGQRPGEERLNKAQTERPAGNAEGHETGKAAQGQRPGEERLNKAQTERPAGNAEGRETGKAAEGQRPGEERMNKAQTERPKTNSETGPTQGERTQGAPQTGQTNQPARTEKGAAATQRNEQAGGATAQGQQRTTHVNPQQVHVTGNTRITNDKAAQLSDTLLATARPQNVNVAVNVGAPLPGEIDLLPLPATIVDIAPEFRGYDYVVVNDEIVIVQPSTRKVVEIINTGGATATSARGVQAMAGSRVNPCGTP